jgi:hypothetical protein
VKAFLGVDEEQKVDSAALMADGKILPTGTTREHDLNAYSRLQKIASGV